MCGVNLVEEMSGGSSVTVGSTLTSVRTVEVAGTCKSLSINMMADQFKNCGWKMYSPRKSARERPVVPP